MNYYNEFDPQAAQWLRNLISAGLIPPGDVDERSIEDVIPNELRGYTQHHFFAGIGGWSLALDLAGWPRDRPVWTGSCPCQPFSSAGKGDGFADQRHLWPAWFHLIRQCKPGVVFGEQVASAIRHGWLDLVSADMEAEDYAVGAAVLGAHSVGAPHIRQRLYWVGDTGRVGREMANVNSGRCAAADGEREAGIAGSAGESDFVGDASSEGLDKQLSDAGVSQDARRNQEREAAQRTGWIGEWQVGADGKARLIEPSIEPLAHGIPARVVRLRAYGNSIVPQAAAAFIGAYMAGESVVELAA